MFLSKKSSSELEMFVRSVSIPAWICFSNGEHIYFNNEYSKYTGLTDKDLRIKWQNLIHSEDLKLTLDIWNNCLKNGLNYQRRERIKGKDGQYKWFMTRVFPIKNDEGKILKWVGFCTDIDEVMEDTKIFKCS